MKYVGRVTEKEKEIISCLYEKKIALENLSKVADPKISDLAEQLKSDYERVWGEYNQWWDETAKKYGWESAEDGFWNIDFENNDVFLHGAEEA